LFESKNNHPINKNLGLVASRFVNSIDTVKANNVQKTILLSSSANSRKLGTPVIISLNENRNAPEDILFKQKDIPVAVLLEGNFTSLYKNRIAQNQLDSLQAAGMQFVAEGNGNGKMIVAADGDIVLNDASQKQGPLPMGMNLFTLGSQYEYQFANREFLLNCLEYLTNKQGIIEARNKEVVLRLLNTKQVEEQQLTWQVINIGLPIFVIVIMGFGYQQIRRKKYAA
jgi:gliding-associated putative ABC transporter substrate-binding component GldG